MDIIRLLPMLKKLPRNERIVFLICVLWLFTACIGPQDNSQSERLVTETTATFQESSESTQEIEITQVPAISSTPVGTRAQKETQAIISPENVSDLIVKEKIFPFFPPIISISGNHAVIAVGDLKGVHIYLADSQEAIMSIDVSLPDCRYGWDAFLALDHTGNFIALVTNKGIEVWQVGGGRVYQAPFVHDQALDPRTCGLDIPQIALSPGGKLLAVSGFGVGGEDYGDYFQIIDLSNNEVLYEWNGSGESPHGQFQTFPGLGFSSDGKVLQTFDPINFVNVIDRSDSFMFWSTDNWQQLQPDSDSVQESVDAGGLTYAISNNEAVEVISKTTNQPLIKKKSEGCTREYPCSVIFSPDGSKFAILKRSENLAFKREQLISRIEIYSLESGAELSSQEILVRNKNAVHLTDEGEIVSLHRLPENTPQWWTHTAYINGFFNHHDGLIAFTPQIADIKSLLPAYSSTCFIDLESTDLICEEGVSQPDGKILSIEKIESGFVIREKGNILSQVKYPPGDAQDAWQIRLKAYDQSTGMGYFCLDRNLREETCVVMNFQENQIILEQVDLFGLINIREFDLSSYIDLEKKELNIFYEASGRRVQVHSYNAITYPLKPAFNNENPNIFYLVENVENGDLYVEEIDLVEASVLKRYTFEILSEITPTAMAVNHNTDLLVISDDAGNIHFLDLLSSEFVRTFPISRSDVIDLIFSRDDKNLVIMDATGEIIVIQVK